ncbi:MAG: 6-phospho-beta-glucosidase [Roseiflexaceae bacterium]
MHIVVIGGASTYTPELIDGLIVRANDLGVTKVTLVDPNHERLAIVGAFAQRMVAHQHAPFVVELTHDRQAALMQAPDFVVTQLRVGGQHARHHDESLGRRHGLIGQETTGVGGFVKALRTVPVMLAIAADIARYAPHATLVNFTNPAGIVTEALARHSSIRSVGLCNNAMTAQRSIANALQVDPLSVRIEQVGLNHLNWIRRVWVDDQDVTDNVLQLSIDELTRHPNPLHIPPRMIQLLHAIPSGYLDYFYMTAAHVDHQRQSPTRAEVVMDVERRLLERYADVHLCEKPPELMERGGAYYSTAAAALICSLHLGDGATHVVNVRNQQSLPDLPADVVVEVPSRVTRQGIMPLAHTPLAPEMHGLAAHVKAYELLTIEAALTGNHESAMRALLSNPLGPDARNVERVWHDILETNAPWLPQFDTPR